MDKAIEFMSKYGTLIAPVMVFLIGWLLPTPKFASLGKKTGEHIPDNIKKLINERIDAFQEGLVNDDFRGDKTILGNSQLVNGVKTLKVDLGLEE